MGPGESALWDLPAVKCEEIFGQTEKCILVLLCVENGVGFKAGENAFRRPLKVELLGCVKGSEEPSESSFCVGNPTDVRTAAPSSRKLLSAL